jgi:hypothetical protein
MWFDQSAKYARASRNFWTIGFSLVDSASKARCGGWRHFNISLLDLTGMTGIGLRIVDAGEELRLELFVFLDWLLVLLSIIFCAGLLVRELFLVGSVATVGWACACDFAFFFDWFGVLVRCGADDTTVVVDGTSFNAGVAVDGWIVAGLDGTTDVDKGTLSCAAGTIGTTTGLDELEEESELTLTVDVLLMEDGTAFDVEEGKGLWESTRELVDGLVTAGVLLGAVTGTAGMSDCGLMSAGGCVDVRGSVWSETSLIGCIEASATGCSGAIKLGSTRSTSGYGFTFPPSETFLYW